MKINYHPASYLLTNKILAPFSFMKTITATILLYMLTSCGISDSNDINKDYFPLQVGNKWYYSNDKSQTLDKAAKWEIVRTIIINDIEYYLVEKTPLYSRKDTSYYRYEGTKLIELFIDKSKNNYYLESIFADFNIHENDSFNYYAETDNDEDIYYKVTLKDRTPSSVALFYDILQFRDTEHSITFQEDKGIVETYSYASGGYTYLIHYELK